MKCQFDGFMKYLAWFVLLMLAGCSSQPTVKSWLDPVSMATVTAQLEPLGLARPETKGAVNGRDYVRLAAVEVNRMGDRRLYLLAALWSNANLSDAQWQDFENSFRQIELRAEDLSVRLNRHPGDSAALGIGQSLLPIPGSRQIYYPIGRAELRAMAESRGVQVTTLGRPDVILRYEERKGGHESLSDFLSQLPPEAPSRQDSGVASKVPARGNAGG